ncbi:hypothetical protein [Streptomyces siamensis]|uniref:Uncharacterized protein n=1 Tax=Streptomyces siamensis TaxID=1274986 RepID=A0ABP9JD24_9ACTN
MYDATLPGHPVEFVRCPLCRQEPVPRQAYSYQDRRRWQKVLTEGDAEAINAYLVRDRAVFKHGPYDGAQCPAQILPGPALFRLAGVDARIKANELMKLLGLL